MEGRSERCFSMNGLTVRVLNNFGNSAGSRVHSLEGHAEESPGRRRSRNHRATEDGRSIS
jgi:hypothetical protein